MITDQGQVYEDVAGGPLRPGLRYESDWWQENHPGVTATMEPSSDNVLHSGDERTVRTTYNPLVQYAFVRCQARLAVLPDRLEAHRSQLLAERAWAYGQGRGHDQRTLFLAEELLAAARLLSLDSPSVNAERLTTLTETLLARQNQQAGMALRGFFMETHGDGYRSIAYSTAPVLALLEAHETWAKQRKNDLAMRIKEAVRCYLDEYLLADAASNGFGLTPYGVYQKPPFAEKQIFRPIGKGYFVRSFVHLYDQVPIPHGTSSVVAAQAHLLAKAGHLWQRNDWMEHAQLLIQWLLGHNPEALSLFTGIGFRHPHAGSFHIHKVPDAPVAGFIGSPEDLPYLETTNAVEWSTQESWDTPFFYLVQAMPYLYD
ncbi:MAG: hypothetical protein HC842_03000 [Cytophagales bacterium]|nr:hypothetical protein [Cytophagales bacterium]